MKVYEKATDNVRHLFYTTNGDIPSSSDSQLSYKDEDGDALTIVPGDTYLDDGHGGMYRLSDTENVNVYTGDKRIIPPATI